MSQLRAQYAEASAPALAPHAAQNGVTARSVSPSHAHPITNGGPVSHSSAPASRRPSSAPGNKPNPNGGFGNGGLTDDDDDDNDVRGPGPVRPAKPPLLRSKSEHGLRYDDDDDKLDEEYCEWGARHGFEDHYQSEDIISQLANVSRRRLSR